MLLPLLMATSSAVIVGAALTNTGYSRQHAEPLALAVGMLAAIATAWWGPGGQSLRMGTRSLVRGATRGRTGRITVVALCGMVLLAVVMVSYRGGFSPDWSPFPAPPSALGL
jgi:hypothetical protein